MQTQVGFERDALHRLPAVLAELLDEPVGSFDRGSEVDGVDLVVDDHGRRWVFEAKSSSRPGVVASAADRLAASGDHDALAVLVVPFMTAAGAAAAADRSLSWLDLSGNAHIRGESFYVFVQGRPNQFAARGRPSSAFAPKSSRVARSLLIDPERWWRQKELAENTGLDDGHISRIVRRLGDDELLERRGSELRPREPGLLLDAWAGDYRFERHDTVIGHATGSGMELAAELHGRLKRAQIDHAFTGLPAAWLLDPFARFRLSTVYVEGDPREAADAIDLRRNERGANVQLIGPDDHGIFMGRHDVDGLPCVTPVQVYIDLLHLPERASEAAQQLRADGRLWHATR